MSDLSQYCLDDLKRSGLGPRDIKARPIGPSELSACGVMTQGRTPDGYVIPYYDIEGTPVAYYRLKFVELQVSGGAKYRNPKGAENHLYFPPGFSACARKAASGGVVLITEGEKKAACAVANGIPCVAVSGVDNWRNRKIIFPEGTKLTPLPNRGVIEAKIPSGDSHEIVSSETGSLAAGFLQLCDFMLLHKLKPVIVFDTDEDGVKPEVQRAACALGYEFRYQGFAVPDIRQLVLRPTKKGMKVGLDDYIVLQGKGKLLHAIKVIQNKRNAFPRHPNPVKHVAAKMQKKSMSRKEAQELALSIFMELEATGRRLKNKATGSVYYFDDQTHTLLEAVLANPRIPPHETSLGQYLYKKFNLGGSDQKIMQWLATIFYGEEGIQESFTHKVLARPDGKPDEIAVQISDSHFVIVTGNPEQPFQMCENGTNGILFEQGQVEPLDYKKVDIALHKQDFDKPKNLWMQVVGNFNFLMPEQGGDVGIDHVRQLAALLYYLSPWFLRWRGLQLPIELMIGRPGSGKSSLYELRQTIITGAPRLSNMTNDIKDWYAGISSRGGLHVLDNVHFTGGGRDYQQRLSDEICRLITEPNPHVELRKLYTTSDIVEMPVHSTFAMTALELPFPNADLIQRAAIFELQPIQSAHNANWAKDMLALGGGRIGWLTHHMAVMHRFLRIATWEGHWDHDYRAGNRLAHYEQALMIMAEVFGMSNEWIPEALRYRTEVKTSEADITLEGLQAFCNSLEEELGAEVGKKRFGVMEITSWAGEHVIYAKSGQLTNSKRLGKYIRDNLVILEKYCGLEPAAPVNNRMMYSIKG